MKKRPRAELKARFGAGTMPSMSDFGMLIESTMNIADDGIEHSERRGLCLTQMNGDERRLLSFYREGMPRAWALGLDSGCGSMAFEVAHAGADALQGNAGGAAVLTLRAPDEGVEESRPRVGINNCRPEYELDVGGTIAAQARRGVEGPAAWADGDWHTIREGLEGCVALEVVAGSGKELTGKYALMHAFALKIFDSKGDITYHRTQYGSRRHRLELQWVQPKGSRKFDLQIKVHCHFGDGVRIRYNITELWGDDTMAGCSAPVRKE